MLNLPRFLFINGPAGSGKSTLARLLCEPEPSCWRESFAEPIREMIRTVFFPEEGPIAYTHDLRDGEVKKKNLMTIANLGESHRSPSPSVREAMIAFSEGYMKPNFGPDIFGRLLWKRCQDQEMYYDHFVIDDSGFAPEAQAIIAKVGAEACILLRLHREGHDFAGDSRGYIDLPCHTIDISNNGAPLEMLAALQLQLGNI